MKKLDFKALASSFKETSSIYVFAKYIMKDLIYSQSKILAKDILIVAVLLPSLILAVLLFILTAIVCFVIFVSALIAKLLAHIKSSIHKVTNGTAVVLLVLLASPVPFVAFSYSSETSGSKITRRKTQSYKPLTVYKPSDTLKVENKPSYIVPKTQKDFNLLAKAIIIVESGNNDKAKSATSSAAGPMQQLKVNVDEANRISELLNLNETFTYNDRFNRRKSIRMFTIIQNFHNSEHSVKKALRLHRGFNSPAYNKKVLAIYDSLKANS